MNCSLSICISLFLLSFSAGMWLLYKTQKENLGMIFKLAAWFIIVMSLGSMVCCGIHSMKQHCMKEGQCEEKQECAMGKGDCKMGGMGDCKMGMGKGMGECSMGHGRGGCKIIICTGDDECEMSRGCDMEGHDKCEGEGGEGECKEGKMDCCKKGKEKCDMKMEMKKDSVVKKK